MTATAAYLWLLAFGAPHLWWLFGYPAAFPGGEENLARALSSPWFLVYDLTVLALCGAASLVVRVVSRPASRRGVMPRPLARLGAWIASVLLTMRGLAGLAVDGVSDLVWWPTFLVGGALFGILAWRSRHDAMHPSLGSDAHARRPGA